MNNNMDMNNNMIVGNEINPNNNMGMTSNTPTESNTSVFNSVPASVNNTTIPTNGNAAATSNVVANNTTTPIASANSTVVPATGAPIANTNNEVKNESAGNDINLSNVGENNIEIGEKYLPIGTVVMLKGGKKRVMISGFCSFPKEEKQMYDYSGCVYPEGFLTSDVVCLFNHDQIEKIYYLGLIDEEEKKFKEMLNVTIEEMKKKGIDMAKVANESDNVFNTKQNENGSKSDDLVSTEIPEMPSI